jgi:hypothetical protein
MRVIEVSKRGFGGLLGGREKAAEDAVVNLFSKALDDSHVMLRNVHLPGSPEKIGLVLVGPDGVWHLDLVHLSRLVKTSMVWMYWDSVGQSVEPVPASEIVEQARVRLSEVRDVLSPQGATVRQAVIMTTPDTPHDFSLLGVDMLVFLDEIAEFANTVMPQYKAETPVDVAAVVDRLTGKAAEVPGADEAPAESAPPTFFQRRFPQLGHLFGWQIAFLAGMTVANCCVLGTLALLLLRG